mgnify:CR=1 FL=1
MLEKAGAVRVVANGALLPAAAMTLSVCTQSERGLLGFAIDPLFQSNGFVYVYYTRAAASAPGGCVNRVSRFTMFGNGINPASEVMLLDNIGSPAGNHNGGDLEVGNDGYLYVAVGDGGCDPRDATFSQCDGANDAGQDNSLLNGKILRVDRTTGAPAPGNPFQGAGTAVCRTRGNSPSTPTTPCREIYAYGLRNPWRFAFDQNTGATRFFINDVGQGTREEIDLGVVGANYGWPVREGNCAQGAAPLSCGSNPVGLTAPIMDYTHASGEGEYITGGAFVPNGAWDATYDGAYLYADGNPGRISVRYANGSHGPLFTNLGGVSDIAFVMEATGWVLYYANPATDEVGRIVFDLSAAPAVDNLTFVPVSPAERAFDSRNIGADSGPLRASSTRLVHLAAPGLHGAALVNLTFVFPASGGYATAWQPRTQRPPTSNANVGGSDVVANAAIVPIDSDGNLLLYTSVQTHLVVDVLGFFDEMPGATAQAGRFEPVTAVRAVDTRRAASASNSFTRAPSGLFDVVNAPLAGSFGLPTSTSAVVLIVTALSGAGAGGYVTVMPHGGVVPPTSNVNVSGVGDGRANLVVVPVGADGSIDLRLRGVTQVLVDVVGSFTSASAPASSSGVFHLLAPTRVVDTRKVQPFGRLSAGATVSVDASVVPADAIAVAHDLVIVGPVGGGYLTAFPAGSPSRPVVSNNNWTTTGQTRASMAITALGGGAAAFYSSGATDLVVDVTGYFGTATV